MVKFGLYLQTKIQIDRQLEEARDRASEVLLIVCTILFRLSFGE